MHYKIHSHFKPCGDQPKAIAKLTRGFDQGIREQTLMGVTGSGKTFTMAHVIAKLGRPALIVAPNKTLAGQLFTEFMEFFPDDAVDFFISYYDYYQPEAYIPSTDTYIAKDASINDDIDKMRHRCTQHLFEQTNIIIIASVSCIYGLGSPNTYSDLAIALKVGAELSRKELLEQLLAIRYSRHDVILKRGTFRVRGEICDIMPAHHKDQAIRVEFFGDEIAELQLIDADSAKTITTLEHITLYPNSHYITGSQSINTVISKIQQDLRAQLQFFNSTGKVLEAKRLEERVMQDIEAFEAFGYCPGIENYSRYLSGHRPGQPPPTLLDYFPDDFLTIVDESHLTIPQLKAMYRGDQVRKQNLVNFGFRLPAAVDNRPLSFDEFKARVDKILYVSATPGEYEKAQSSPHIIQQIIRPTGLIDPEIMIKPARTQMDELYGELRDLTSRGGKAFILTLTKRMAEDISTYFADMGFRIRYMHSQIKTLERTEILRDLREDKFDILVGINLLREGLDLPEVSLVTILDADKEGFLRSKSSLIQMVGRAARNRHGRVIFFADHITQSMRAAMDETTRRRNLQIKFNATHGISPQSIHKKLQPDLRTIYGLPSREAAVKHDESGSRAPDSASSGHSPAELTAMIQHKTLAMKQAAGDLNFEQALTLKRELTQLKAALHAHSSTP